MPLEMIVFKRYSANKNLGILQNFKSMKNSF